MHLEHSFTVPAGINEAWKLLLDVERVGPFMPGASVDSVEGDDFAGSLKVKLGPINLTYKGAATFLEKDESAHRAIIDARAQDARGTSVATAVLTALLEESDGTTTVRISTELDITGKPAQFGRSVMEDVGNKLFSQFADTLSGVIRGADTAPADGTTPAKKARPKPVKAAQPPADASARAAEPPAAEPEAPTPAELAESLPDVAESIPSYAAPGGIPVASGAVSSVSAVNGHLPGAAPEVEPINLLDHTRPAMAKRLAPVAVALVVVFAAMRRKAGKRA